VTSLRRSEKYGFKKICISSGNTLELQGIFHNFAALQPSSGISQDSPTMAEKEFDNLRSKGRRTILVSGF
jgi:hypothetical protein